MDSALPPRIWRPIEVFDRVGYVNFGFFDTRGRKRFVENSTCWPDEWVARKVFLVSGLLTNQHQPCPGGTLAKDRLCCPGPQIAASTACRSSSKTRERSPRWQERKNAEIQCLLYWKVKLFPVRSVPSEASMLARCVNEHCKRPLYSFSEGRLFQFEVVSISIAASDEGSAPFDEKPQRDTVHFWLCGQCASTLSLVLEPARGLKLVSLNEQSADNSEQNVAREDIIQAKRC